MHCEAKEATLNNKGQRTQKGCGTVETKFEADLHERDPDGGGGVALVSLSAQRKTDYHSGGPSGTGGSQRKAVRM